MKGATPTLKRLSDLKTSEVIALLIFGIFVSCPAFAAVPQIASVTFSVPKTVGGSKLQGVVSLVSAALTTLQIGVSFPTRGFGRAFILTP